MDHSSSNSFSFSSPLFVTGLFLFAMGLIVGGIVGVMAWGGMEEIKSSLASVRGEVTRVRVETDGLHRKVNGLQAAADSSKAEISEKLAAESKRIGQLDAKVHGLEKEQAALKTQTSQFASKLATEIRRINELGSKVQGVEKNVASGAAETRRLASDSEAIRADLKSLRSEFGNTDSSFDKLIGALAGIGQ